MTHSHRPDPTSARPLVMVSVGTDHHPFDRLVTWVDEWAAAHPEIEVIVQRGTAGEPRTVESMELVPHDELRRLFARAAAVVSHGGPSTVMDARMAGRLPIVVPRDPTRGEHVDDHQMRFARHLERHGLAELASSPEELARRLAVHLADPEAHTVAIDPGGAAGGVVRFGELLDALLDTRTPLRAATPATSVDPVAPEVAR